MHRVQFGDGFDLTKKMSGSAPFFNTRHNQRIQHDLTALRRNPGYFRCPNDYSAAYLLSVWPYVVMPLRIVVRTLVSPARDANSLSQWSRAVSFGFRDRQLK